MSPERLTGLVLTRGELPALATIAQLGQVCAQVVVVRDKTVEPEPGFSNALSAKPGITLIDRSFDTFPRQRNAGIDQAMGEWVLSIDDDELLSDVLIGEIQAFEPEGDASVYAVRRCDTLDGKQLSHSFLHSPYHPRLFQATHRYAPHPIMHTEFIDYDYSRMGFLDHRIMHNPRISSLQFAKKSFLQGLESARCGEISTHSWIKTIATLPGLIIKRGFWRDGRQGLAAAAAIAAFRLGAKLQSPRPTR